MTVTGFESGSIIAVTEIEAVDAAKDMKKLEDAVKGGAIEVAGHPVNKDVPVTSSNAGQLFCVDKDKCGEHGTCNVTGEGFCQCNPSFIGDLCETENECVARNPCVNGATCKTMDGGKAKCECATAYSGEFCQIPVNLKDDLLEKIETVSVSVDAIRWEVFAMTIIVALAFIAIIIIFVIMRKKPGSYAPIAY